VAVALPRSPAEVRDVVRAATAAGLRVAPQHTGQDAGPSTSQDLSDVVLVRTSRMDRVAVNTERRVARVEGGAVWLPTVEAAAEHGLSALHGPSPDDGIAGYCLGGGVGWYARRLGLAANSLAAVELVLADGSQVRADADHDTELFWALRGGGGGFGVVTSLELSLFRIASAYAGMLVWDACHAEQVLRRWAAWAIEAPDEVTTSFRLLHLPRVPQVPAQLRRRSVVVVDGAVLGTDLHGRELLGDLRDLAPEIDTFDRVPASSLVRRWLDVRTDLDGATPVVRESAMLGSLPEAAVDAFLAHVGPGGRTSLIGAEIRQLGGALGRPHQGGGALSHLDASFLTVGGATATTPDTVAPGSADDNRLSAAMAPWTKGRTCLDVTGAPVDTCPAYLDTVRRRLAEVRTAVDPDGVFVAAPQVQASARASAQGIGPGVTTRLRPDRLAR
jgi:FAD/FMN-containing dehydrogenase